MAHKHREYRPPSPKKKVRMAIEKLNSSRDFYRHLYDRKETIAFQNELRELFRVYRNAFSAEAETLGDYDAYRRLSGAIANITNPKGRNKFNDADRLNTVSGELLATVTSLRGNPEEWISAGWLRTVCTLLRDVSKMGMWMNIREHNYAFALEVFAKVSPQKDDRGKKNKLGSEKAKILAKSENLRKAGMDFVEAVLLTEPPRTLFDAD